MMCRSSVILFVVMRFSKITILLVFILSLPVSFGHAAESSGTTSSGHSLSGMSHKVLSNTQQNTTASPAPLYNAQKPTPSSGVKFLSRTTHQKEFDTDFKTAPDPEQTPHNAQRVWDTYKNLAAGLEHPLPNDSTKQDEETIVGSQSAPIAPSVKPSGAKIGLDGILEQYYANKESRSKMRILRANTATENSETDQN
jgi:hypothetical protein